MTKSLNYDHLTGKAIERDLTPSELAEFDSLADEVQAKEYEIATKATAKAALLERLGITADEAALLLS